ncbi:uncharacterized protein PGTG_22217 [Puccinia graminis f. sp. tritici CRL 75-36-700-3]|uniref:Uncharacterized protein n=1 Tax=Puccinia graminis f. sp. tritici (strain CRL 75-36-700-3 / race SCCL) TaxID=418459 RepID=H6QTT3_PUCGT|nr:uncharacterized protein PGTG_22217 [Puccinia graminis f. sp. tritici CRL 75-36-700-3]EHS64347.1 hypothetical protein PGTG_22217 [Puccinia graminis f. sp. tritici CRL 75-36-700-3]
MDVIQRRPVGLYYEQWLLPGQQPAYLCRLCNSKKTFQSIKNHERWIKHKERVRDRDALLANRGGRDGSWDTRQVDDMRVDNPTPAGMGQADVLARLDAGFGGGAYDDDIDWRTDDGQIDDVNEPVRGDDFDERFSDVSLNGLALIIRNIRQSSPVDSDYSSAAPSVWGFGDDDELLAGGDRDAEGEVDEVRHLGDRGWFPFKDKTVSPLAPWARGHVRT